MTEQTGWVLPLGAIEPCPGDCGTPVPDRPNPTYCWDGQAWQPTAETTNAPLRAEIEALETSITSRRWREASLTSEGRAWLQALDIQVATLRAQLKK